jgi:DNA-binding transcriptional LysR family regulator
MFRLLLIIFMDIDFHELQVFGAVADERSFSRAARKLGRTQPAVSQAVRRLEQALGEPLFDRSTRDGAMTEAGRVLREYARRLLQLATEAETAVREIRDVQRGRVLVGANEAAVHALLPVVAEFQSGYPKVQVDVRRIPARQMASELLSRSLDFGVLTFQPPEKGLASLTIGADELVLLTHPSDPLARRRSVSMEEVGRQHVIAHNDPSPAREHVLRVYEQRHVPLNIAVALPSLDAIKRAVEMKMGVALLPKRCALSEIALGQLAAVRVPGLRMARHLRLIYRSSGERSPSAEAFLRVARSWHLERFEMRNKR